VRILFSTTANDGHFGPLLPFARAAVAAGHEVRVAAPSSYAGALGRAGLEHAPFADAPPELIGPIMAGLASLPFEEADRVVIREVFARVDAQAGLPALLETVELWRPDVVVRESAELGSLAAAERYGVPHVHACIGMHEVDSTFAAAIGDPLEELERLAGVSAGRLAEALAEETVLSLVPEMLDHAAGEVPEAAYAYHRFHEPLVPPDEPRSPDWGDPDRPLVYVTFGSVAGSIPVFAGVFREALDALADLDASILMTVGRAVDPEGLGPLPDNATVVQWLPQDAVLAHAAAMLGHGGFGTTMGALAAGVPQVVAPLFSFDQKVNGEHVAAVGAGLTAGAGPGSVSRAAAELPGLLAESSYVAGARRVAAALRDLPPPSVAVSLLAGLVVDGSSR
jgi:UDP:flavonoid glycosyltransferase YjiC (YdhE family)